MFDVLRRLLHSCLPHAHRYPASSSRKSPHRICAAQHVPSWNRTCSALLARAFAQCRNCAKERAYLARSISPIAIGRLQRYAMDFAYGKGLEMFGLRNLQANRWQSLGPDPRASLVLANLPSAGIV